MDQPEVHIPPADVVPQTGLTADALRLLDTLSDEPAAFTFPGDVVLDVDGIPAGVEQSHTITSTATVRISRAELDRTGLTEKEISSVRITD